MTVTDRQQPYRLPLNWGTPVLICLLVGLLVWLPPDGLERAAWAQFLGRFHLLTVHFPIALIFLVPVFELSAKRLRLPHLRRSIDFLLVLAMVSSLVAATLGWSLARSGAYTGRLVTQHMWGGVLVAVACWGCWMARHYARGRRLQFVYPSAVCATVLLVSWTGYRGGQLSQGENHLTEEMPPALRQLAGLPTALEVRPRSDPAYFYGAHVEPILVTHCYECHSPNKQKGRLRMDTYEALMRGGKHGRAIIAGDSERSELFRRITLPSSDDDAMPPPGKRPLTADEVKVLELWIASGASSTLPADGIKNLPANATASVAEVTFPELDPAEVAKIRAPHATEVSQLKQRFPDVLDYESRGSANLVLDASALGSRFGDDDLAAMKPVAGEIAVADLSGTAVTDRSALELASMSSVRVLRLTKTGISDVTVMALAGLDRLESLDLYGTAVTPACLTVVPNLPRLIHLYAGETKIPAGAPLAPELKNKIIF